MTPNQAKDIKNAYDEIMHLSQSSNWGDAGIWREVLKLERKEGLDITAAKGNCVKAWLAGANQPDRPAHDFYQLRYGYLHAFLLGVRQYMERAKCEYTGPIFAKAYEAATAGAQAYDQYVTDSFNQSRAQLMEMQQ